jgi:hypothetical protein
MSSKIFDSWEPGNSVEYLNYRITEGGQSYVEKRRPRVRLMKRKVEGKMKKVKIKENMLTK